MELYVTIKGKKMDRKDKMMDKTAINEYHRIMSTPRAKAWGIQVSATGRRLIPPHHNYFRDHETQYPWRKGRILPEYGMVYLTKGQGVFRSHQSAEITVQAGDLFFLFPDIWHLYHPHKETGWEEYWITFDGAIIRHLANHQILKPGQPLLRPGITVSLCDAFKKIIELADDRPTHFEGTLAVNVMQLIIRAHELCAAGNAPSSQICPAIQNAKDYIEEHCNEPLSIDELANLSHMSERHFSRVFKDTTGLPPKQYYNQVRIHQAKALLARGDQTVSQVAHALGFEDAYYFSKLFKKLAGRAPSAWREIGPETRNMLDSKTEPGPGVKRKQ